MQFFKKYPKLSKFSCVACLTCGAGWLYYQIKTTRDILSNALDTTIFNIAEPPAVERLENQDFLVINAGTDYSKAPQSFSSILNSARFSYAKRLLTLANNNNKHVRRLAVQQLARIRKLENWQYSQLCDMMDARTAVSLARTQDPDPRFFVNPPLRYLGHSHEMLVDVLKDLLVNLQEMSQHPCMGYFLTRVFMDVEDKYGDEFPCFELTKYIQSHEELIPMCLESLLHHASVGRYAKDIASLNGLPLLMEIYGRFKDNLNVTATIARIIAYLSMHDELLDELYHSGWISILAQWLNHDDVRISIAAIKALTNLDREEKHVYYQRLYPLHPSGFSSQEPNVDVVFVHGLLGGVFFTWRQRKRENNPIIGFRGKEPPESLTQDSWDCLNANIKKAKPQIRISSDPDLQEYFDSLEEYCEKDTCKNYEVVLEDIPVNTNEEAMGPYCNLHKKIICDDKDCFTNCWPKDWLPEDCDRLRVVGVNYESNLSLWTPICPSERVKNLSERSDELIEQLSKIEIGKRPIVWITHSMGGLIVKCLLNKAAESSDKTIRNMYLNTKGIIFYSTPHVGSTVAKFNTASALVIWPSVEVQELKKYSPQLMEIHDSFLKLVQKRPIEIVTFVETQPTVVSAMKFKFLVVEPDSGNPGCGEYYEIPLDHLGICKPASRQSFLYQKVLHTIKKVLPSKGNEM